MTELSMRVLRICDQHYGGWDAQKNGCGTCPLEPACIDRTKKDLEKWRSDLNQLASETGDTPC